MKNIFNTPTFGSERRENQVFTFSPEDLENLITGQEIELKRGEKFFYLLKDENKNLTWVEVFSVTEGKERNELWNFKFSPATGKWKLWLRKGEQSDLQSLGMPAIQDLNGYCSEFMELIKTRDVFPNETLNTLIIDEKEIKFENQGKIFYLSAYREENSIDGKWRFFVANEVWNAIGRLELSTETGTRTWLDGYGVYEPLKFAVKALNAKQDFVKELLFMKKTTKQTNQDLIDTLE